MSFLLPLDGMFCKCLLSLIWFNSDGFLLQTFCLNDLSIEENEDKIPDISVWEPTSPF